MNLHEEISEHSFAIIIISTDGDESAVEFNGMDREREQSKTIMICDDDADAVHHMFYAS